MMKKNINARNEIEYIDHYQNMGYTKNFRVENQKLKGSSVNEEYDPGQLKIVAQHRFEGISNPSDMSILYVIETYDGVKGTSLVGYGPTADLEVANFFASISEKHYI